MIATHRPLIASHPYATMSLMAKFKISYLTGTSETVDAEGYGDLGEWIEFRRPKPRNADAVEQVLRVRAAEVHRIDLEPTT